MDISLAALVTDWKQTAPNILHEQQALRKCPNPKFQASISSAENLIIYLLALMLLWTPCMSIKEQTTSFFTVLKASEDGHESTSRC